MGNCLTSPSPTGEGAAVCETMLSITDAGEVFARKGQILIKVDLHLKSKIFSAKLTLPKEYI